MPNLSGILGANLRDSNKREQSEHLLYKSNIDCIGLSETWLKQSPPEALVSVPGYKVFRKDRTKVLLVKRCYFQLIFVLTVLLYKSLSREILFSLICLYRQPNTKVYFYDQLKLLLNSCNPNKETIFVEDFNINWDNKQNRKNLKANHGCS